MMQQGRYPCQALSFVLVGLLFLGGAHAQGPAPVTGPPVIQLRDGTLYSGEILEWLPDTYVVLRLPSGEVRRFLWAELAPEVLPPTAPPPAPLPPAAQIAPVEWTQVDIRSKRPGIALTRETIFTYTRDDLPFVPSPRPARVFCPAPCNQIVPQGGYYRITGQEIIASAPFSLPPGRATLDVRAGTWGGLTGGILLVTFGSTAAIIGAALFGGNVAGIGEPPPGTTRASVGIGGLVTMIVGAGLVAGGIVMLVQNQTKVRIFDAQGNRVRPFALRLSSHRTLALSPAGLHF